MCPTFTIIGRPYNCRPSDKSRFAGLDESTVTVEELVLQTLEEERWRGVHCEGSVFRTLFSLLLWDVIFCQDGPLDLDSPCFSESRRDILTARLHEIRQASPQMIRDWILTTWTEKQGLRCRGVDWDKWEAPSLAAVAEGLGGRSLSSVCGHIAHGVGSAGLPDLCCWRESEAGYETQLVEVKGPNDTLSHKQKVWIDKLLEAEVHVQVALVQLPKP